jgi:type IV secretion system protein VirB10
VSFWRRPDNEGSANERSGETQPEVTSATDANGIDASAVAGERGIASVNRVRSVQSRVSSLLAIGLMATLGVGLLTWYYSQALTRGGREQRAARQATERKAQGEMPLPPLGPIERPKMVPVAPPAPAAPTTPPESAAAARPAAPGTVYALLGAPPPLPSGLDRPPFEATAHRASASGGHRANPEAEALRRKLVGAVWIIPKGAGRAEALASEAVPSVAFTGIQATGPSAPNTVPGTGAVSPEGLASRLSPTVLSTTEARVLPTTRLLLPKGTFLDCTLETAIDTSLAGFTTCIMPTDVFSADGDVVLLERGTKLIGETRGAVQPGSARVFVVWNEARTPSGIVVPLGSPGTDELGRAGLPGAVNRHFTERFGAALLVSIVNGAVQGFVQSQSNGAVVVNPSTSTDIMTEVLRNTINIPPTVLKPQGDRIQILVARDIDFRSVYALRTTH